MTEKITSIRECASLIECPLTHIGIREDNIKAMEEGRGNFAAVLRLLDAAGIDFNAMLHQVIHEEKLKRVEMKTLRNSD